VLKLSGFCRAQRVDAGVKFLGYLYSLLGVQFCLGSYSCQLRYSLLFFFGAGLRFS